MNRRRLLLIGFVAVILGGFVSTFVYRTLQQRLIPEKPALSVVIATRDIAVGQKLEERDTRLVKYPGDFLPSDVLRSTAGATGKWASIPMVKGDFVTAAKLSYDGEMMSLIPVGMRAEAVSVTAPIARSAKPGYRVDVLVTGSAPGGRKLQTVTLLQNVVVIPMADSNSQAVVRDPSVVTLLVSPEDAQKLTLAGQTGRIQLIFRNPIDASQERRAPIQDLFAGKERRPNRVKYSPPPIPPPSYEIQLLRGDHRETFKVQ